MASTSMRRREVSSEAAARRTKRTAAQRRQGPKRKQPRPKRPGARRKVGAKAPPPPPVQPVRPARRKPLALPEALALRRRISRSRPRFQRQESWRYKRIKDSWRRPRGVDSKMRLRVKGWPKRVSVEYRGPRSTRGLHPSGLRDVVVHNLSELRRLNPEKDAARIGHTVGRRKRIALLTRARELGIRVLNPQGAESPPAGE